MLWHAPAATVTAGYVCALLALYMPPYSRALSMDMFAYMTFGLDFGLCGSAQGHDAASLMICNLRDASI